MYLWDRCNAHDASASCLHTVCFAVWYVQSFQHSNAAACGPFAASVFGPNVVRSPRSGMPALNRRLDCISP